MTHPTNTKKESFFPSVFSDFFGTERFFNRHWLEREFNQTLPAVNVLEKDKAYVIEFAAPGFSKQDFEISVDNNLLTVSAEKKTETTKDEPRFTRREFHYNTFSRSFTLPQGTNTEKVDAQYNNGILELTVAKKEESKPTTRKEIKVL